jgi:hypothetical protein
MELRHYVFITFALLLIIFIDDQVFIGKPVGNGRYLRLSIMIIALMYYTFGVTWINSAAAINPVVQPF